MIVALLGWRLSDQFGQKQRDSFPNQPIQIVVPYQAGGGSDTFARIIEQSLSKNKKLGVPIAIINRPGGSATIGSRYVKDSRPDGYRILCHHEGIIATKLSGTVTFGPEAFEPVAQTASKILLMIVRADSEYQSLTDLLEAAQREPNTIRMGANQGSPAWFICKQMLIEYPGAEFNFVPADGSKRNQFLLNDKLDAGIFSLDEYMANRSSPETPPDQNILAIGNFSESRHPDVADVATSIEQGLKTHAENSYYFWAPKDTPDEVIDTLAAAFEDAITDPVVVKGLQRLSIPTSFRKGTELKQHLSKRVEAFEKIAVKVDAELPDFASWLIGVVVLLGTVVVVGQLRSPHENGSSDVVRFNRTGMLCLLLLGGYVLLLQFSVPYAIATAAVIFLMGGTIAHWRPERLVSIGQIALLVALSTDLIFTKLFSVPLP